MPTMVTMNKAAELTGVKYSALRRWIKSGEFTYYVMAGTRYLINLERLIDFEHTRHGVGLEPGRYVRWAS